MSVITIVHDEAPARWPGAGVSLLRRWIARHIAGEEDFDD